jgi:hypothetical protein
MVKLLILESHRLLRKLVLSSSMCVEGVRKGREFDASLIQLLAAFELLEVFKFVSN